MTIARAPIDRNGLVILERHECLALLQSVCLGRVGVTIGALPTVLPVNFLLHNDQILIRTREGLKLAAALDGNVVAFEADDFDPVEHTGWSVVVTGRARSIDDPDDFERAKELPIPRWAPVADTHIVAISTEMISGRKTPLPRPSPETPAPIDL